MSVLVRLFAYAAFALVMSSAIARAEITFKHQEIQDDAVRYELTIAKAAQPKGRAAAAWRKEGEAALKAGDFRKALDALQTAVVADPKAAGAWLSLEIGRAHV